MFLKRLIKDILALFRLVCLCQKGVSVLMYHSIDSNDVFFTVKPDVFARQIKYLKIHEYQVISLADLVGILESDEPLPKKTVVLCFDDGYQDNYLNAWPILKKYNFPATIFLATGLIGQEINNSQNIPLRALSWSEIEEMHQSGLIDFEPHTVHHQELNKSEIIDSKIIIEQNLDKKCYFFAYPRGWYDQEIIGILRKNGFKASHTVETGKVNKGDDLFKLKRISVNSTTSFIQFKANL